MSIPGEGGIDGVGWSKRNGSKDVCGSCTCDHRHSKINK